MRVDKAFYAVTPRTGPSAVGGIDVRTTLFSLRRTPSLRLCDGMFDLQLTLPGLTELGLQSLILWLNSSVAFFV